MFSCYFLLFVWFFCMLTFFVVRCYFFKCVVIPDLFAVCLLISPSIILITSVISLVSSTFFSLLGLVGSVCCGVYRFVLCNLVIVFVLVVFAVLLLCCSF